MKSLAVAYNMKKRMNKKSAPSNEKLSSSYEPNDTDDIVQSIMSKSKSGMIEDSGDEMEAASESADDFLTADEDTHVPHLGYPEGANESEDGAGEMEGKKKKILASILDSLR